MFSTMNKLTFKILAMLFCMCIASAEAGAQSYTVYSVNGDVQYMDKGKAVTLTARKVLRASDRLVIGKYSAVTLLDERLLINGAFGYRDNALTNQANFIGDFEVKWRMNQKGTLYVKAYNQTNDRYFTKATLNTQGLGLTWRHDFESIRKRMKEKKKQQKASK